MLVYITKILVMTGTAGGLVFLTAGHPKRCQGKHKAGPFDSIE
jgi:hypothetical protein